MISISYYKENAEKIKDSIKKRNYNFPIEELESLIEKVGKRRKTLEELRHRQNKGSEEISKMKKEGKGDESKVKELAEIKAKIEELEKELKSDEERLDELLFNLPNFLHESVPVGVDERDNKEIYSWGEKKDKAIPPHDEILESAGLLDAQKAGEVAGSRFYYLKGDIALMELALIRFAVDRILAKGYTLVTPPFMIRKKYFRGATSHMNFKESIYRVTEPGEAKDENFEHIEDELFLIGTAEHAIAAMHANEVLNGSQLPIKYVGVSPCFRREAGSHGKDTKGIFRVHQFYKVEQFIFSNEKDSWSALEELRKNGEELIKELGIPYRVVILSTGDISLVSAKTYDVEGYMPGQKRYRELQSHSNCLDWQSRRLEIRYDEGGKRKYVHTLNGTALAVERTIVAIIENYCNEKGEIEVPKALVPYMNGLEYIRPLKK
ncbi:MAG: serine--tRNA ligase [Candidatus Micrarchaeaceae archaeon]